MTDPKIALAEAAADIQAATAAVDTLNTQLAADDALIASQQAQIASLQNQLAWDGIDNTGATDVTAAVQAILSAGAATMPPGRYLIDPTVSLTVTHDLTMASDAVLVAKANSAPRYYVLKVTADNVTVKGGHIIGDRLSHTYTTGSTHEWGYGISVTGAGVTIDGLRVEQCTGDGIGVTGADNTVQNVVSTKNRRQGMSVFTAPGLRVIDSEFSYTGALGTDPAAPNGPCAGADIEPDVASTIAPTFTNCKFLNNRAGLLAWLRVEVGGSLNVTANNCTMSNNANGAQAKALAGSIAMTINGCTMSKNSGNAVRGETGSTTTISGNTIIGMATRTAFDLTGMDTRTKYDINTTTGGAYSVGLNHYA